MTAGGTRGTVLVADDDPEFRRLVVELVEGAGFAPVEAGDGIAALLQAERARPEVVVLDIMMPRLGGLEALGRIRRSDHSVRVLVVTGLHDQELHSQALRLGAAAVFVKPFPLADLGAALRGSSGLRVPEGTEPPVPASRASGPRVLVVDDESDIRDLLREFLAEQRYDVSAAEDGAVALRAVIESPPDVVLLDIDMPRLGGLEALTAIRAIAPDTAVIMISGKASVEVARRTLAYGAFDYVAKPFDMKHLAQTVEIALTLKGR